MARTPNVTEVTQHIVTDADTPALPAMKEAADAVAAADAVIMGSFDAIKAIGRIETARFYATVADKLIAETAIFIKTSKQYNGLPYKDENGKTRQVAGFDEFCAVFLGKSARRVQELVNNYKQLGPELFEQAEKLGFRQRDYNALKALPAEDQKIIEQAIESQSLDNALDLMQQLAAKHQREKTDLSTKAAELEKTLASKDAVIAKKDEKLNDLDHQLEMIRLDRPQGAPRMDWPAAFKNGYFVQLQVTYRNIKSALGSLDLIRIDAMKLEPESEADEAALDQAKEMLADELVRIHNECIEMMEALGMVFDKTLGGYSNKRIAWIMQASGLAE